MEYSPGEATGIVCCTNWLNFVFLLYLNKAFIEGAFLMLMGIEFKRDQRRRDLEPVEIDSICCFKLTDWVLFACT